MQDDLQKLNELNRRLETDIRQRMGDCLEDFSFEELCHLGQEMQDAVTVIRERKGSVMVSCRVLLFLYKKNMINQGDIFGELISLSEEELVECVTSYNEGCNGGLMDYAFEFIIKNGGIDSEKDYPYTGRDGRCDTYRKNAKVVTIDDYEDAPTYDEKSLQKAVANQPVAVAIEGGGRDFQLYDSRGAT